MNYQDRIAEIENNNTGKKSYSGLVDLPLEVIDLENEKALLRPADIESNDYKNLVASIKDKGQLSAITVRRNSHSPGRFVICGGVQRYTAIKELGHTTIHATYFPNIASGEDILVTQIAENVQRVIQKPTQLGKQLKRILALNPEMGLKDLADLTNKSMGWCSNLMGLSRLNDNIQKIVDSGAIPVANAIALARLPEDHQDSWIDRAKEMASNEFLPECAAEYDRLKREQKTGKSEEWQPTAHPRGKKELYSKIGELTPVVDEDTEVDENDSTYLRGMFDGLKWAIGLDAESVAKQIREREERAIETQKKQAERQHQKDIEKAAKAGAQKLLNVEQPEFA